MFSSKRAWRMDGNKVREKSHPNNDDDFALSETNGDSRCSGVM